MRRTTDHALSAAPAAEQLALVRGRPASAARQAPTDLAGALPVARVVLDVALPHLDRPFDYAVPASMADEAIPGVRVRVRFAGQDVDGFVVDRLEVSEHPGRLTPLRRVVSSEAVLTPEVLRVARAVADHYAGSLADVLRLAVPPRHARAEKEPATSGRPAETLHARAEVEPATPVQPADGPAHLPRAPRSDPAALRPFSEPDARARWSGYDNGPQLLAALARGASPAAVWAALPGPDPVSGHWPRWPGDLAAAVHACTASGRGALIVVPDGRDVDLVSAALDVHLGPGRHLALTADLGPMKRYRRWLAVLRGTCRVVVGTRSAMFAPVADLGLVAVWDDGDDLHAEPRAPYPHVREVLAIRAREAGAALLVGGLAVTAEGADLVRRGTARAVTPLRAATRRAGPLVRIAGDDGESDRHAAANRGRLPGLAFDTARSALDGGPVLVQVPRAGYVPSLACARCRAPAHCTRCHGPLRLGAADEAPSCRLCGLIAESWRCAVCTWRVLRAPVVGAARTAQELGRAFPTVPVVSSGGDHVVAHVPARPALVVATPGAEPIAAGGYSAALLLDGWALLGRADLRASEEALRRWLTATALVRSAGDGGRVVLMAPPEAAAAQALVRADPFGAAERELADRTSAGFVPAASVATITGEAAAIADLMSLLELPADTDILGPVGAGGEEQRLVVRTTVARRGELAAALRAGVSLRSARKSPGSVRIQLDPTDVG